MVIAIFGASGRVGRLVVTEALARGHSVRAFVHHTDNLPDHPKLVTIQGDIHNRQAVTEAVHGSQAVVSALGSWHTPSKDIVATAMRSIIPAMEAGGIDRIISLTGTAAYDISDKPTLLRGCSHLLTRLIANRILADGEEHIKLLRASQLDWTVLRAPAMTNKAQIFYKLSLQPVPIWQTIPRRAVAKAMLDQLDGAGYTAAAPFIHP